MTKNNMWIQMTQELHTSRVGLVVCQKYLVQKKTLKVEHLQEVIEKD